MFRSIMVHVDSLNGSAERTRLAIDLAHQFDARLIGLAAGVPRLPIEGHNPTLSALAIDADYSDFDRMGIEEEFSKAAASFNQATQGSGLETDWRTISEPPSVAIIRAATAADLVVLGPGDQSLLGDFTSTSVGDVILHTGRPILVVPVGRDRIKLQNVVVAWKEGPEAQRAIADAIPFMKGTGSVVIVHVQEDDVSASALADPQGFLVRHGIAAKTLILQPGQDAVEEQIIGFANRSQADLIVSGAYGHSRLREWVFGGVTHGLLTSSPVPCLFSH
jgi:nucleotide-binding universal stress UspA family protein